MPLGYAAPWQSRGVGEASWASNRPRTRRAVSADLHWSCQKPERRATERDDDAIERWQRYRWIAIKEDASD